eukprot:1432931-Pyramimonas_sp.AAC.1
MTKFEELADAPTPDGTARDASEAEPPQEDGRLPTMQEEAEADLESHAMDAWQAELQDEKELLEATPLEDIFTIPTQTIPDHSVLITAAEEQRGHLP